MKKLSVVAVGSALMFAALPASAEDLPPPPFISAVAISDGQIDAAVTRLDSLAEALMKKTGIPGMAVAVVKEGKTVYAKGFGIRRVGAPDKVDADTVFQLASLSKAVAGTVVAHEVGAGRVSWETPVIEYLPWFRLKDPWVSEHVTIADLMSHRSGLPDHGGDNLEDIGFDRRAVMERLRLLPLDPFRISYAYTNFGFTSGAEAVAVSAGKDWATLSEDALYKPLGMASTSSRFADFDTRANKVVNHVPVNGSFAPKYQRQPDAQSPAGGVSSSVNDMARWMAMVLEGGTYEGKPIIDAEALLPAISAQMISGPSSAVAARPGFYGYGFNVSINPAGRVQLSHSGAFSSGAATAFTMLPSAGVGIIVLTNAWPLGAPEALAAEFTDLVQFGKIERDWLAAYGARLAAVNRPTGSLVGKERPRNPAPAARLSDYVGTYSSDYYGTLDIVRSGEGLAVRLGPAGKPYKLAHWDGDAFTFEPSSENATDGSISLATFKKQASSFGSVTLESLDENGLGTFARK
ncbi:CubicO group peptidase (beta-lactamase class C family) [Angulomicrobium tetraedrale]|uniref:CubicO group peptidase (Beta-lactamase class C family) n=1 Tax=Ancylobacter tetraedralis TaxID=217068 RepID=A0A839ZGT5_9HYPH|nr:serine hydrolase [Ancylobacter tetraedralis]MBB3773772.1 CubicO group peptidase (beta-lactamase class C family) [Ancylobacter tetraedralis]